MDEEWAQGVLTWWINTAERALSNGGGQRYAFASVTKSEVSLLRVKEDQTREVIARVMGSATLPVLMNTLGAGKHVELQKGIDTTSYALGRLRTRAETRAKLGTNAPTMKADALHPLVWGAASKHWDVGHHSAAVQRAATMLNADVQDRVGRHDVSDSTLMQQTFSADPPTVERPRLRWPGEDSDLTVKAMRQGILNMTQGVFSAIRNPATHSTEDMERQEALEQLATLSILARWIERCELVTV